MTDLLVAEPVREALERNAPVVALESTIIAHGLPWPANLEIARALEDEVRRGGAVPATIAVLGGVPRVGLDDAALERLAKSGPAFVKAGASDLPVALARRADAATTVSATTVLAARAGIAVFATGGIGGVHRGEAGDVSQDLTVLAREPVAVVSAGAKAILDLPRTVEALETLGVLVIGYRTGELPAFYVPSSGVPLEHRAESAAEIAAILEARFRRLRQGGVLVCNPIPAEAALDAPRIERPIEASLARAAAAGVRGKALTPFLLADLARVTGGDSIRANRALALSNAALAAAIAGAYAAARTGAPATPATSS